MKGSAVVHGFCVHWEEVQGWHFFTQVLTSQQEAQVFCVGQYLLSVEQPPLELPAVHIKGCSISQRVVLSQTDLEHGALQLNVGTYGAGVGAGQAEASQHE